MSGPEQALTIDEQSILDISRGVILGKTADHLQSARNQQAESVHNHANESFVRPTSSLLMRSEGVRLLGNVASMEDPTVHGIAEVRAYRPDFAWAHATEQPFKPFLGFYEVFFVEGGSKQPETYAVAENRQWRIADRTFHPGVFSYMMGLIDNTQDAIPLFEEASERQLEQLHSNGQLQLLEEAALDVLEQTERGMFDRMQHLSEAMIQYRLTSWRDADFAHIDN